MTESLSELPNGIRLVASVVDTLIQPEVKSILEYGVPMRDLLKDQGEEKVKKFLVDALTPLRGSEVALSTADLLVNSSLNLIKISKFSRKSISTPELLCSSDQLNDILMLNGNQSSLLYGMSDTLCDMNAEDVHILLKLLLKELLCSADHLNDILILSNQTLITSLSETLCDMDAEEVHSLFKLFQEELDFTLLVKRLSTGLQEAGLPNIDENLNKVLLRVDKTKLFTNQTHLLNSTYWAEEESNSSSKQPSNSLLNMTQASRARGAKSLTTNPSTYPLDVMIPVRKVVSNVSNSLYSHLKAVLLYSLTT